MLIKHWQFIKRHHLLWLGLGIGCAYWGMESALHSLIFDGARGEFSLWPSNAHELYMRGLVCCLLAGFGVYADRVVRREQRLLLERAEAQSRLEEALTKVLDGFLCICSSCKKVRDADRWLPVELYVHKHTDARFSHGLCPECVERLYPGILLPSERG